MSTSSRKRPAALILVVQPAPAGDPTEPAFGSYAAVASAGQRILSAELSRRFGSAGAAVAPLAPVAPLAGEAFHWGRWFAASARAALAEAGDRSVDAIGYAGAGSLALANDALLDELASPIAGEVVANNRYSADAFVVAGDLDAALTALAGCSTDNAAVRCLEAAGFGVRDLSAQPWSRFDVDTPLDLALLRIGLRLPAARLPDPGLRTFLEMATLPGGRGLEIADLDAFGEVVRNRERQLVVAGRLPSATWAYLETEAACRVRCFVEERGMRAARDLAPRSLLADWITRLGPADLVGELASLGDALVLDTRVLMATLGGSSDASAWPPAEERFASDFGDATGIATTWLRELVEAAARAPIPVLLGGHALVSDGLRVLVDAAWLGH
ncbi:MAG TPA: hypothetical protein VJA85_08470 [Candidatus Limnocylindria bacterium]|nr:hypothetical protein [Candidatus Limnocylindria bacterium]